MELAHRLPLAVLLLLPAALTVYLSFNAGGFFVGAPAIAATALALALAARAAGARRPLTGLGLPAAVVSCGLALFVIWTLLSATWSGAPGRALVEADRALLYLLAFVLFASFPSSPRNLGSLLRWTALGIGVVCTIALVTRLAPDVWPIEPNVHDERLSYPLTYWNALGLLAALGTVFCLHLTTAKYERPWTKAAAAGAIPVLAATLLLTFSRGAVVVAVLGLIGYLLLARPGSAWIGLAAVAPPTAIALAVAYAAELVASPDYTQPAAVAQGHRAALVIGICVLASAGLRLALHALEHPIARAVERLPGRGRAVAAATALVALVALSLVAPLADAPGYVQRQYETFVEGEALPSGGELRGRLTSASSNGRLDHWEVALGRFRDAPVGGDGAGTYRLSWAEHRPGVLVVNDAHSLYLEVLGELGAVGLLLIVVVIGTLMASLVRRALAARRREGPGEYAVLCAATAMWALHAGIDWDWELPAVTLWVFALGGAALAARLGERRLAFAPRAPARVGLAALFVLLAAMPVLMALSQSRLDSSVAALKRGDCSQAIDSALDSLSVVSVRAEPWEVIGYCDARLGRGSLAVRALEEAVERDPENWEVHYGLALVRAAAGLDPRRSARRALELNPNEELIQAAIAGFRGEDPAGWRRTARSAELPIR